MSSLVSKLGKPKEKVRLRGWAVAFLVFWAVTTIAATIVSRADGQRFPVAYLALMCGMFSAFVFLMVATVRSERPKPIEYSQSLELKGSMLTILEPSPWVFDLAMENGYVLCLHKGTQHASIRFLRDEGDITIYFHAPSSLADLWVSGDASTPNGPWLGTIEYRDKFGAALLKQVRENKSQNRYWTHLQQLLEAHLRRADDASIVKLGDDDDDDALTYRSSGKPRPEEPGYAAWLASYGLEVAGGVFLSEQHLVAVCKDGARRAFPIGHHLLERGPKGLTVNADGETHALSLDAALAEALLERLRSVERLADAQAETRDS